MDQTEPYTILVVDDEPEILELYRRHLTSGPDPATAYRLLLAGSGEKAEELVRAELALGRRVACGFFDMRLPGIDGAETIRRVRALDPNVLVVVVSASDDGTIEDLVSTFAGREDECAYLHKPFTGLEIRVKARSKTALWARRRLEAPGESDLEGKAPLPTGLERYSIERLLGAGGMGRVFLAHDTRLGRRVALKVVTASLESHGVDRTFVALREARAAASISHPNVAAVYDVGQHGEQAFIAMEYVPGTSLRRMVGEPSVALPLRLRWLADAALALAAAHEAGVVHRDVKPDNVIVRDDGVIKVVDFGVARLTQGVPGDPSGPTWSGKGVVGTPSYLAPEVVRGGACDARADQFGWAVLAYELLTGRLPWSDTRTKFTAMASVLMDTPAPLGAEIPAGVSAVILRAMSKDPGGRFASLADAATALLVATDAASLVPTSLPLSSSPGSGEPPSPVPFVMLNAETLLSPDRVRPLESPGSPAPSGPATPPRGPRPPDFAAPVDLDAHLDLIPPRATCKGLFFLDALVFASPVCTQDELSRKAGIPRRRYVAWGDYPLAEHHRLLFAIARAVHPELPVGEVLRRVGQRALDTLLGSQFGKTLFGVLGRQLEPIFVHAPKAYRALVGAGEVTTTSTPPGLHVARFRSFPFFLETVQVGVVEGLLRHCQRQGEILVDLDGLADGTLTLRLVA